MPGMDMPVALKQRKGRGAASNASGRFEAERRLAFDDGWGAADEEPSPLATTLSVDSTRTIIARNDSPDIGFDRSINPYRGCEHGCIYCYARPSHAYLGLSPGLDFESRLFYKPQAPKLLAGELRKKGYSCRPIALGSNTDPYQPVERKLGVTRAILEVLRDFRHPVTIVTKSALIQRDLDILSEMARERLAMAAISVTTLDRRLARVMEPRAAIPERRLETIAALAAAGVPVGVMSAPMIPALNDSEMEQILERARAAGATSAAYTLLRLPLELKELFKEWLVQTKDRDRRLCRCPAAALRARLPQARFQRANDATARHQSLYAAAAKGRSAGPVLGNPFGQTIRSVFPKGCTSLSIEQSGEKASVARERRLEAREVGAIFAAFAEAMRELPPDVEAGWLDAHGDLRLAPDIARKLRTARRVRLLLQELQQREREE